MVGKKSIAAGFLVAALAGCQSDDQEKGVFSCTGEQRGANVSLLDQGAELTLTEQRILTVYPYMRGHKTIYRDVTDQSAAEELKKKARAYCATGAMPQ